MSALDGSTGAAAPLRAPRWARIGPRSALIYGLAGFVLVVLAWQISALAFGLSERLYPTPHGVFWSFVDLIEKGILPVHVAASLQRYAAGVALGTVLAVSLGLLFGLNRFVARMMLPLVNFLYAIVEVAWIPLFVLWFGYGEKVILLALVYVVTFPVLFNCLVGVLSVPQVYINAVRSLGASRLQVVTQVILPAMLPNFMTGFRVGAGFAFRGLVFGEVIAAQTGLGFLIFEGAQMQDTARTVVGMIAMGALWLFFDQVYLRPLERASLERWGMLAGEGETGGGRT
jgi:NitT/TauT family transport system permease protein/taurine transport system permease protein